MTLHIIKLCVGCDSIEDLANWQAQRIRDQKKRKVKKPELVHVTRMTPKRTEEILSGGSLYWVIRGQIRARQRITGFRSERDDKGRAYCLIEVAPELVATVWRPWRPFQGWRYLLPADAPPDRNAGEGDDPDGAPMPARMAAELRALGLL